MKILLLGASGQVGFELQRSPAPLGNVMAPTRAALDLADLNCVAGFLRHFAPDLIVNAAAWTAVDAAEEHQEEAYQLNAELPEQLAYYAHQHGKWLVHYSSDYVYAGAGERPHQEDDPCQPLSVYGKSKLAGDQAIIESGAQHLIFRTSWVYSARGHNFLNTMLRLGRERSELKVVNDQVGAPTSARLIADTTALALTSLVSPRIAPMARGIYHLAPGARQAGTALPARSSARPSNAANGWPSPPQTCSPSPPATTPRQPNGRSTPGWTSAS